MATPLTSGTRFVNQLFAGRERVATAAELLSVLLNNSMYTYKAAGPMMLVENEVVGRLAAKAGLAGGDGMFTPGGSMSNLAAMIVARNEIVEARASRASTGGPARCMSRRRGTTRSARTRT
jgi:sulfinoalanine decarboxylase